MSPRSALARISTRCACSSAGSARSTSSHRQRGAGGRGAAAGMRPGPPRPMARRGHPVTVVDSPCIRPARPGPRLTWPLADGLTLRVRLSGRRERDTSEVDAPIRQGLEMVDLVAHRGADLPQQGSHLRRGPSRRTRPPRWLRTVGSKAGPASPGSAPARPPPARHRSASPGSASVSSSASRSASVMPWVVIGSLK